MVDTNKTSFPANEPVIVAHVVLWALVNLGAFIVGHTHLFTQTQWDSLTTGLVPFITAFVLGVTATVLRKYVSPWWKKFQEVETKAGFPALSDVQLDALAEKIYESLLGKGTIPSQEPPLPPLIDSNDEVPPYPADASTGS